MKRSFLHGSGDESSDVPSIHRRAPKGSRSKPLSKGRTRSGTASSTQTGNSVHTDEGTVVYSRPLLAAPALPEQGNDTPTRHSFSDRDDQSTPEPPALETQSSSSSPWSSRAPSSVPLPATATTATEDSDTDFQSAYSTSPRGSYGSLENDQDENESIDKITLKDNLTRKPSTFSINRRQRVSSSSTTRAETNAIV